MFFFTPNEIIACIKYFMQIGFFFFFVRIITFKDVANKLHRTNNIS